MLYDISSTFKITIELRCFYKPKARLLSNSNLLMLSFPK